MIFLGPDKLTSCSSYFWTPNIVELIFLGSLEVILTSVYIVSGYFLFIVQVSNIGVGDGSLGGGRCSLPNFGKICKNQQ